MGRTVLGLIRLFVPQTCHLYIIEAVHFQILDPYPPWAVCPEFLTRLRLTGREWDVYITLARFRNWDSGRTFVGQTTIAECLMIPRENVGRLLRKLERKGALYSHLSPGHKSKCYHLVPAPGPSRGSINTEGHQDGEVHGPSEGSTYMDHLNGPETKVLTESLNIRR